MKSTVLYSNVSSVFNKLDELSIQLHQHKVDIDVFVESWFGEHISDDAVKINGYQNISKDREKDAGARW